MGNEDRVLVPAPVGHIDVAWLLDQGRRHNACGVEVEPSLSMPDIGEGGDRDEVHGVVVVEKTHVPGPGVAAIARRAISSSSVSGSGLMADSSLTIRPCPPASEASIGFLSGRPSHACSRHPHMPPVRAERAAVAPPT